MEKKYNGMFSISPVKRIFYNDKTGETTTYNINEREILDIRNENIYDTKGKLIKEETQEKYNTLFLLSFDRAHVLYIKKFLDYQFEKTPIKEDFINYLEYGIYPNQIIKGGIKSLMADWIKDKRETLKKSNLKSKKEKISAPVKRRFCELINDSQIDIRLEIESSEKYCERICKKYNYDYSIRVSKYFQKNNKPKKTDSHLQIVINEILPNIPTKEKEKIMEYINGHIKMYV